MWESVPRSGWPADYALMNESEDLQGGSWTSEVISEYVQDDTGNTQTVNATIPVLFYHRSLMASNNSISSIEWDRRNARMWELDFDMLAIHERA